MEDTNLFDDDSAKRIAKTVRWAEGVMPGDEEAFKATPTTPMQVCKIIERIDDGDFYRAYVVDGKTRGILDVDVECVVEAVSGEKFKPDQFLLCRFIGEDDEDGLGLFATFIPVVKKEVVTNVECDGGSLVVTKEEVFVIDFDADAP